MAMNSQQTSYILQAHADIVTDAAYDYYGLKLATCGLDQRIKVWKLNEQTGDWAVEDEWKAHDAAIVKISWAHPEHGSILASCSFDRTVRVWEERRYEPRTASQSRWYCRAYLTDARGSVRAVEFAPPHFGLKLATISTDMHIRIYECLEIHNLSSWTIVEELDVSVLPSPMATAMGTPTLTSATLEGVASSLTPGNPTAPSRPGIGNREGDGGWCLSWCKDKWWGEVVAVAAGQGGMVKILEFPPTQRPVCLLSLAFQPPGAGSHRPSSSIFAVTSVSWAPSCGRSYHLVATGSRDGIVRIFKLKPPKQGAPSGDDSKWSYTLDAEFNDHQASVGRVEWNVTGTILSSAGDDGKVRLFKCLYMKNWQCIGSFTTEQGQDGGEEVDVTGEDRQ